MSKEMADLIRERKKTIKKKKDQSPYALGVLAISVVIGILLIKLQYILGICWIIGIIIGFVLRCSRFCFASAFRDPILLRNTRILRGIIIAMMISTLGFAVIQANYLGNYGGDYNAIPGAISSVGLHVVIGAFLFGMGMIMAGGCASGVLMRIGEGHSLQWVVLLGFIIGTVLGAKDYGFWYKLIISKGKTIYFLEYFDLRLTVIIQLMVLGGLYYAAIRYEKRHKVSTMEEKKWL